jgi:hypothetical protein
MSGDHSLCLGRLRKGEAVPGTPLEEVDAMTVQEHHTDHEQVASPPMNLLWSWACLCLIPFFFFAGFAAAHLPGVWFNVEEGAAGPWYYSLLVGVMLIGVTWLPVGGSLLFGRRALRAGSRAAWVPVSIGLLLTASAAALAVVAVFG